MKTFERIILHLLMCGFIVYFIGLIFCKLDVPVFEVNANIIIAAFLLTSILGFITPTWDVGKYLETSDVKKINQFKLMYRLPFLLLAFSFFGLIAVASSKIALEIIGWLMEAFGISWFIFFYIRLRTRDE